MSLLFNAVKASKGLFKPLPLQRYNKKMIYANKNKKNVHAGLHPPLSVSGGASAFVFTKTRDDTG